MGVGEGRGRGGGGGRGHYKNVNHFLNTVYQWYSVHLGLYQEIVRQFQCCFFANILHNKAACAYFPGKDSQDSCCIERMHLFSCCIGRMHLFLVI